MPKKKELKEVKEEKAEKAAEKAAESAIIKFSNVTVKLTAVDKVVWMEVLD